MHTPRGSTTLGLLVVVVMIGAAGAALYHVLRSPTRPPPDALAVPLADTEPVPFEISALDRVCKQYVDEVGLVNYRGLAEDDADLEAFLDRVREVSPHSNLATFPSEQEALAYWINAYNAWMLRAVLDAYPVSSVKDIPGDPGVFDAGTRLCGGEALSLNHIEHEIVRGEFADPRAHFALNCASMSCPWLPREAFDPERLDEQLARETFRFFAAESHLQVDLQSRVVRLSPILVWYQEDFLGWLRDVKQIGAPELLDYVRIYAPADVANKIGDDFEVQWLEYDWRLNDQSAAWARERG